MGDMIQSAMRRAREFMKARGGKSPSFLLVDPATYRALRDEFKREMPYAKMDANLTGFMGARIVVVPVAEMLAAVGEPADEVDRYDLSDVTGWRPR